MALIVNESLITGTAIQKPTASFVTAAVPGGYHYYLRRKEG